MFTPTEPYRFRSGHDEAARLTLTINEGGSTESEDSDVTVIPEMSSPRPTVMTLTAPAKWRIAPRKSWAETSRLSWTMGAEVMASSQDLSFLAGPQQFVQDRSLEPGKLGRAA